MECSTLAFNIVCYDSALHGIQHCMVFSTVWHSTLCGIQHCIVFNTVWYSALYSIQRCMVLNIVWYSTVYGIQHSIVFSTVWYSTLFVGRRWMVFSIVQHQLLTVELSSAPDLLNLLLVEVFSLLLLSEAFFLQVDFPVYSTFKVLRFRFSKSETKWSE